MKIVITSAVSSQERRLLAFTEVPSKLPIEEQSKTEEADESRDDRAEELPLRVYGRARAVMDEIGVEVKGKVVTFAGNRLSFDDETKSVAIFSHKGRLYIEITNRNGSRDTVVIEQSGDFHIEKEEANAKSRNELPLSSVVIIKDAREWINDLNVNREVVDQLHSATKNGLELRDNSSKTNGLLVMKNGRKIGEITVLWNHNWQEELSRLIETSFPQNQTPKRRENNPKKR
ncbi:MAG TPA: hypothetical protein VMV69_10255 [Pirellulales bacterium]|nr:hypothetical protein [Pirellulales bacterium]